MRCFKIIQALGQVDIIEILNRFEFDKKDFFNKKISYIFTYSNTIIKYYDCVLLLDVQARLAKLMRQCVFIYLV